MNPARLAFRRADEPVVVHLKGRLGNQLFEFAAGQPYLRPEAHPNYTKFPGALGRYWEIVVRLGNDPQSIATAAGDRHGWPQADLLAFEFIFDAYQNKSDEAYSVTWCKQALAIGGWGCGSASWRRAR